MSEEKKIQQLETKDLILKKASFEDWQDMYCNLWSHEESARYMLWNVTKSEEEAKSRMERTLKFQESHLGAFTVYEKASGQAIGFAGIEQIDDEVYEETGIAIGPKFVGKGYGKQILRALVECCFKQLQGKKVIATYRSENIASKKMQMACGFVYHHSEDRVDPRNGQRYVLIFNELSNQ